MSYSHLANSSQRPLSGEQDNPLVPSGSAMQPLDSRTTQPLDNSDEAARLYSQDVADLIAGKATRSTTQPHATPDSTVQSRTEEVVGNAPSSESQLPNASAPSANADVASSPSHTESESPSRPLRSFTMDSPDGKPIPDHTRSPSPDQETYGYQCISPGPVNREGSMAVRPPSLFDEPTYDESEEEVRFRYFRWLFSMIKDDKERALARSDNDGKSQVLKWEKKRLDRVLLDIKMLEMGIWELDCFFRERLEDIYIYFYDNFPRDHIYVRHVREMHRIMDTRAEEMFI